MSLVRADRNWKAFDKDWFRLRRRQLLGWINGRAARLIRRNLGLPLHGVVVGIGPEYVLVEENGLRGEFYPGPVIAKRLYFSLLPLWWSMHLWDLLAPPLFGQRFNLGYDILTAYPDRGSGLTTVDGIVGRSVYSETFAALRSGAGTAYSTGAGYDYVYLHSSAARANEFSSLTRGIMTFDTSPMGPGAVISDAYLGIRLFNKFAYLGPTAMHVVQSTPAANNDLVAADYGATGTTSAGNLPYASWIPDVYNNLVLNSYGRGLIDPAGITKLGLRLEWDQAGAFTGTWLAGTYTGYWYWTADIYEPGYAPKLVVTFTRPYRPMVVVVDS